MKINYASATANDRRFVEELHASPEFRRAYTGPESVQDMRTSMLPIPGRNAATPLPADVTVTSCAIAGVPCEKLATAGARVDKLIVFLHGGGFVRGSLELGRKTAATLAAQTNIPVLCVGYRQAPEHRFPAAGEDMLRVYGALLDSGYAATSIVVAGESAGGCLALTLPAYRAQHGCPLPAGMVGICPMTTMRTEGASWHFNAARDLATIPMGQRMIDLYIDEADRDSPLASPVHAPMSTDCAFLLCVGSYEIMLSDVERFAWRADDAGADVTLNLYEAMPHGFTKFGIDATALAIADVGRWCKARLNIA